MKIAKIIAILGVLAMTAIITYAFAQGDFAREGAQLTAMPWGIVSLVDLYTGFTLFSGWIIYREKSPFIAALWVVLMMGLGFFTGSLYVLIALIASKGDWKRFWLGQRA
jgi:hypothetical protein